jgi:hypothetical protein
MRTQQIIGKYKKQKKSMQKRNNEKRENKR